MNLSAFFLISLFLIQPFLKENIFFSKASLRAGKTRANQAKPIMFENFISFVIPASAIHLVGGVGNPAKTAKLKPDESNHLRAVGMGAERRPAGQTYFHKQKNNPFSENKPGRQSIYSKHWPGPLPVQNDKNPVVLHDIFVLSFDSKRKFPVWVAYFLSPALLWGHSKEKRKYIADPLLGSEASLSAKDYKGASHCDNTTGGYSRGHLAPVGSFKASPYAYQAQYLSNIVPQTKNLNQGPWRELEEKVRGFVKKGNEARILTGPVFGKEGKNKIPPCWKAAQGRIEEIPYAYWKIVATGRKSKTKICSFLMPQKMNKQNIPAKKFIVKIEQIEKETGLKLSLNIRKIVQDCRFLY